MMSARVAAGTRRAIGIAIVWAMLLSAAGSEAEAIEPGSNSVVVRDSLAALHAKEMLTAIHSESGAPGIAAAISVGDSIVWHDERGFVDLDSRAPVTTDTRFRIGSVSKAVTAVALLRLWQSGAIDLDADVRAYVPDFPDKDVVITPRLLAGHLAGIRNYEDKDFETGRHIDRARFETTREALAIFADDSLLSRPAERYRYSVFGYTLLSAAMEGAADEPFLGLLQSLVIDPLGLTATGADSAGTPGLATPYEREEDGGASVAEPLDFSYKWAGGGLYSNALDLARLGSAVLDPEFVSPAALDLLATSLTTIDGDSTHVSIGWRVARDSRGRRFIHHAGSISGGRAVLIVYPDHRVSIAITSNQALAPLMIEASAQVVAEPFLLERENRRFDRIRWVGDFAYTWAIGEAEHRGWLCYGTPPATDRIDIPENLVSWSERLGTPFESPEGKLLPMLLTGETAFIPLVTPAGAFAIDAEIRSDDSLVGSAIGQFVRVRGPFEAERSRGRCGAELNP